jgi:hypothetical protein
MQPLNLHSRIGNCTCGAALYRLTNVFGVWCRQCGATAFGVQEFAAVFADRGLRAAIVSSVLLDYDVAGARNPVTGRGDLDAVAEHCIATGDTRLAERCIRELRAPVPPAYTPPGADSLPGHYYVSAVRDSARPGDAYVLLAGPFDNHTTALAQVERVRRFAERCDPTADRYAFGTCRTETAAVSRLGCDPAAWS